MMTLRNLPFLLLSWPLAALGQMPGSAAEQTTEDALNMTNIGDKNFDTVSFNKRDDGVLGTPMLDPGWRPGEVWLVGQARPLRLPLKYDLYRQELRLRRPQGDSVIVALTRVQEFSWPTATPGGSPQHFVRCQAPALPPELVGTCAELLVPGAHWQLLKLHRKVLGQQVDPNSNLLQPVQQKVFLPRTTYYLRWESTGRLEPVRPKRAALETALQNQPAARTALRARREAIGNEAELVAAVTALDPLVQ